MVYIGIILGIVLGIIGWSVTWKYFHHFISLSDRVQTSNFDYMIKRICASGFIAVLCFYGVLSFFS